jgi:hypothetical protein
MSLVQLHRPSTFVDIAFAFEKQHMFAYVGHLITTSTPTSTSTNTTTSTFLLSGGGC